jgi:predicted chitinase
MLATPYLETARAMWPVKETVMPHHKNKLPTDATVIARLNRAWASGKLGQVSNPYWRNGWFGRGFPQLTHKRNYIKASDMVGVDLVANPDAALDVKLSARILVGGSVAGIFTGKKLSDYLPGDYKGARRVINGQDRAHEIATYAGMFEKYLRAAGYRTAPDTPEALSSMAPPETDQPAPKRSPAIAYAIIGGVSALWLAAANFACNIPLIVHLFKLTCGG